MEKYKLICSDYGDQLSENVNIFLEQEHKQNPNLSWFPIGRPFVVKDGWAQALMAVKKLTRKKQ